MCIRDSLDLLCGLYTAFTVTLMHKDCLDKLVEHGNGQLVEVLVLVNQSDKTISVLFVLLIALDSLFQSRDFGVKLGLFLFGLSAQSGVSAVGQLSQNVVLIDFTEQDFQLGNSLLGGGKDVYKRQVLRFA